MLGTIRPSCLPLDVTACKAAYTNASDRATPKLNNAPLKQTIVMARHPACENRFIPVFVHFWSTAIDAPLQVSNTSALGFEMVGVAVSRCVELTAGYQARDLLKEAADALCSFLKVGAATLYRFRSR